MKPLSVALFLLSFAVPLFADSFTIFNYGTVSGRFSGGFSIQMVPGTQQQLLYTLNFARPTTDILFEAVVDTTQFSSLSLTFTSAATGSVTTDFTTAQSCFLSGVQYQCLADFQIPTHDSDHGPFLGSLTVNLNGKLTQTYNFQYMIPYPEPSTLLFLGTGLAAIGFRAIVRAKS